MISNSSWLYIFLFGFCTTISLTNGDCNLAQTYFIRHTGSGLTLDVHGPSPPLVTVENFSGLEGQQWRFTCGSQPGLYYIESLANGYVLDIQRGFPYYVMTSQIDGTLYQQWAIAASGRFVNAQMPTFSIDIYGGVFYPGNNLWMYEDNDTIAQEFMLQEKM